MSCGLLLGAHALWPKSIVLQTGGSCYVSHQHIQLDRRGSLCVQRIQFCSNRPLNMDAISCLMCPTIVLLGAMVTDYPAC